MRGAHSANEYWKQGEHGKAVIDYELDEDGIVNLLEAVLDRAGKDYMNELPIDGNITKQQREIETFIRTIYGKDKAQGIIDRLRRQHPYLNKPNNSRRRK